MKKSKKYLLLGDMLELEIDPKDTTRSFRLINRTDI